MISKVKLIYSVEAFVKHETEEQLSDWLDTHTPEEVATMVKDNNKILSSDYAEEVECRVRDDSDYDIDITQRKFTDIKAGDEVVVFDEYSHDYIEHTIKITSVENDPDYITETNIAGLHFYGEDVNYQEYEEDYISNVHEGNFVRFK